MSWQSWFLCFGFILLAANVTARVISKRRSRRYIDDRKWPLETVCGCGHTYGQHKAVPLGQPSRCKAWVLDSWECSIYCSCEAFTPTSQPSQRAGDPLDDYYEKLGNELEQHPIGNAGIKRGP